MLVNENASRWLAFKWFIPSVFFFCMFFCGWLCCAWLSFLLACHSYTYFGLMYHQECFSDISPGAFHQAPWTERNRKLNFMVIILFCSLLGLNWNIDDCQVVLCFYYIDYSFGFQKDSTYFFFYHFGFIYWDH